MKALRWHGREDVRVEDVATPEPSQFADSVIEVSLCGICGSDLAEYRHGPAMISPRPHPLSGQEPPLTLGHELVGTLIEGGSPDGRIKPGDRVTVDACLRCGTCGACERGDYHLCRYGGAIGLHSDGAFASHIAVPGYTLVAVPDGVGDRQAALSEPFAVALHGLERGGIAAGEDVLVLGFGPIGAAAALTARALGGNPHVVELDEGRRERAAELGLPAWQPGDDLAKRVRRSLGEGGAPLVVETTGVAAMVPVAIECASRAGRIVLLGLPAAASEVSARRLTLFERSLIGSLGYRHDLPRVLGLVAAGSLDPEAIVGNTVSLAESAAEVARLAAKPGATIKTLVATR